MEHNTQKVSKGLLQSDDLYQYILETSVYPREPETLKELRDATASHPIHSSLMNFCQNCQNAANVIERKVTGGRKIRCPYYRVCDAADDIVRVNGPYEAKLLCQELFSMGISLKNQALLSECMNE